MKSKLNLSMHNKSVRNVLTILSPSIVLRAMAMDIFIPCLTAVATEFAVSFAYAQWVLSIYFIGAGLGQLALGPLSDRYGRRIVLLASLVVFTISSLACAFANSINMLIVMRLLQGLGACGTTVVTFAMVRDLYEDHISAKVYSHMYAIVGLAPLLAPLLGGSILVWTGSWRTVFYFVAAFGVLAFVVTYHAVLETSPRHIKQKPLDFASEITTNLAPDSQAHAKVNFARIIRNYQRILSDREFLSYIFCATSGLAVLFLFFSTSSVLLVDILGISADTYGLYFGLNSIIYMAANIISPSLQKHYGINKVIFYGSLLAFIGGTSMLLLSLTNGLSLWNLLLPNAVITFGVGWLYGPCAAGSMRKFKDIAGTVSATYGAILYCVGALVVTAVMQIPVTSTNPLAITVIILSLVSMCLFRSQYFQSQRL